MLKTREPQYAPLLDESRETRLGLMSSFIWNDNPRRLLFGLARYKFVARMLEGRQHALEVGCADAFGTRLVQQTVGNVSVADFDPVFLQDIRARLDDEWLLGVYLHDMVKTPLIPLPNFDAAYALDVLEHIKPEDEDRFIRNILASLTDTGVLIFGMPSIESQVYASPQSLAGHVNCKTGDDLKKTMERYFNTVFMFSMNDEVVHTGFYPMAHYLFAVCSHRRD